MTQQPLSAEQVRLERAIAGDLDPAGRRAAIDVYADEQGGRRELLRSLSTESDPVVRRWAALAMERRAAPEDGVALQQLALSEPDPVVKNILERAAARSAR